MTVPAQAEPLLWKSQDYERTATQRELALTAAQMPTGNPLERKTVFGLSLPSEMQRILLNG